ncbi:His/Gly/Thr/Pro-type tRNA ligase C-terminal domain-containing protein, partial [Halomonas sp. KM-1]|uniref:His/Gly/Thr/Pro-type tRNA ligase C-terminal domain-containing protein n=1 Tax=Halomonas sp. KM-1 TaxID=590061 RepID=UPI000474C814
VLLLETLELVPDSALGELDLYVLPMDDVATTQAMLLAERIRSELPELRLQLHCGGGSFKSRIKKADKSGARLALLLGEDELEAGRATLKFLREEREQMSLDQGALIDTLASMTASDERA